MHIIRSDHTSLLHLHRFFRYLAWVFIFAFTPCILTQTPALSTLYIFRTGSLLVNYFLVCVITRLISTLHVADVQNNIKMWLYDVLGVRLKDKLCGAFANSWDKSRFLKFVSVSYISMTWRSVSFAQKWPLEGDFLLSCSEYISETVTSTCVKRFNQHFYLSKECEYVCRLCVHQTLHGGNICMSAFCRWKWS